MSSSDKSEPPRCVALTRDGRHCQYRAVKDGRCRLHIVDEIVPKDEIEALRQLEDAAAQHALDAHFSNEDGGSDAKDQEFNRNARTAAALARARHALAPKPGAWPEPEAEIAPPDNAREEKSAGESDSPPAKHEGESTVDEEEKE